MFVWTESNRNKKSAQIDIEVSRYLIHLNANMREIDVEHVLVNHELMINRSDAAFCKITDMPKEGEFPYITSRTRYDPMIIFYDYKNGFKDSCRVDRLYLRLN